MSEKLSFMRNLFEGVIDEELLLNYPFFSEKNSEEYDMMIESIRQWLKTDVNSDEVDKQEKIPAQCLDAMKEMGLFGLIIPEEYGGLGFNQTQYARLLEVLNGIDSSITITAGAHSSIGLKALSLFGNDEQKKLYYPKLASGEMIAAFALTEPGAGSDAAGITTRAVKKKDHYELNGTKLWITNGGFADFFTVFAKEEIDGKDKMTAFIVTRDMGGVTNGQEEHKLGIKGSSTVEINLKNTKVPLDHVIGKPGDGFKIAMHVLNQGRTGLAAGAIGPMKRAVQIATDFSLERKAFGSKIMEFEVIQNLLLESICEIYSAESMTYFTTFLVDQKNIEYSLEAAASKVYATDAAWRTINRCIQILGGNGYMRDYVVERMLRDARIGLIFEGTNEILKQYIALSGLKDPAEKLKDLSKGLKSAQETFKAGKTLESINQAMNQLGMLSDFTFSSIKKQLFLSTPIGLHEVLKKESEILSSLTRDLNGSVFRLLNRHGKQIITKQIQLDRLGSIAIEVYKVACVLSRCQTLLTKKGLTEETKKEVRLVKKIISDSNQATSLLLRDLKHNRGGTQRKALTENISSGYPYDIGLVK
jgi:acyl-CoA dehydrogenase family protein 9